MNYLAHLVLSGKNEEVLFGNFIADAVKGKSYLTWSKNIQKGILLHRFIDHYTDINPHYLAGKRRFYEKFPKMGGVINDILYDYLLWQYELKHKNIQLDKEIIQDLIIAAHNDAKNKLKSKTSEEISKATGGLGVPGFKWPL